MLRAQPSSEHEKSTEEFCLRWHNFQSNLLSVFDRLFHDEQFVDVTIACDGHLIKAHKMVLSASSAYFQQMFMLNPCKHPIVIMKDVPLAELRQILEFIYKGEINVQKCDIPQLLVVAEALQIRGLAQVNHVDEPKPSTSNACSREQRKTNRSDRSANRKRHSASMKSSTLIDDNVKAPKIQHKSTDRITLPSQDVFIGTNNAGIDDPDNAEPILIGSLQSVKSELDDELFEGYSNMDDSVSLSLQRFSLIKSI